MCDYVIDEGDMQLSYFIVYDIMAGIVCWYGVLKVALEMQHDWCENRFGLCTYWVMHLLWYVAAFLLDSALVYIYTMAYLQDECSVGLFTYCIYQVYSRSCEPMLGRLNPLA